MESATACVDDSGSMTEKGDTHAKRHGHYRAPRQIVFRSTISLVVTSNSVCISVALLAFSKPQYFLTDIRLLLPQSPTLAEPKDGYQTTLMLLQPLTAMIPI